MTINLISKDNTLWAADEFIRYFSRMGNIEDYLRYVKKETVKSFSALTSFEDEFLNEDKDTKYISMHPIEVIAKSYNLT